MGGTSTNIGQSARSIRREAVSLLPGLTSSFSMTVPSSEDKPHGHGKYLAVITLLTLLVVGLGGVAGYYYANRTTVQGTKPAPPTLTIRLFSQQVSFTRWNDTVTFTNSPTLSCNGITVPGTIIIQAENFTENLSGRDPGSTWVDFKGENGGPVLFRGADLTMSLIRDLFCGFFSSGFRANSLLGSGSTWRVLSSGNYTLFSTYQIGTTPVATAFPGGAISESWTVTTISTD